MSLSSGAEDLSEVVSFGGGDDDENEQGREKKHARYTDVPFAKVKKQQGEQVKQELEEANSQITKFCRACQFGYFTERSSEASVGVGALIKDLAFNVDISYLIDCVYKLGESERKHIIDLGLPDPGEFTRHDVEHHLFYCMKNFGLSMVREIHETRVLSDRIKNKIFRVDEKGNEDINIKAFNAYLKLQLSQKALWTTPSDKSASFNPQLNIVSGSRKKHGVV
jgi:hypothetical protein